MNEINLLRNNDNRTDSDIEKIREFYSFLTGNVMPEKISMGRGEAPKMSGKKAFAIIWYLQEHLPVFPDHFERCYNCGEIYDTYYDGSCVEEVGKTLCGSCCS